MEKELLRKEVEQIKMPKEMEDEIVRNCYGKMEDEAMTKNNIKKFKIRPAAAAAVMALCLCMVGITSMAATGKLEGFFKDVKNWNGAVVGTSYEQATDEVEVFAEAQEGTLKVELIMLHQNEAPYSELDEFGIEAYRILDSQKNVVLEGHTEMNTVQNGKTGMEIALQSLTKGEYIFEVTKLVGGSKADQPLVLTGNWECKFVY